MITHRELEGSWAVCPEPDVCELLFHFPGQAPDELAALPESMVYAILNTIDPPHHVDEAGDRYWYNALGEPHRDYDLPATIYADGTLIWQWEGKYHRGGEQPAIVAPGGWCEWWEEGSILVTRDAAGVYKAVTDRRDYDAGDPEEARGLRARLIRRDLDTAQADR